MCATEEKRLDCFEESLSLEGISGNHINNLLDLSLDMKCLLKNKLMTDIVLSVNGNQKIYSHKDVLKFRSKWFYSAVCEAEAKEVKVIEINENSRVMESVLFYIYTGDLRLLESSDIYLVEVHEASKKYGFSRLSKITKRMLQENEYREIITHTNFQWNVKVEDGSVLDSECPDLNNFTINGSDKWRMKVKSINSTEDDDYTNIVVCLDRKTEESCSTAHNVLITIRVNDCNGKCRYLLNDKLEFLVDSEHSLNKYIPLTKLIKEYANVLSDAFLTLTCELKFCARVGFLTKFRLTGSYRKYIFNEMVHLSDDMFKVFRDGRTHDVSFSRCHVKIHNYILFARSRMPKDFLGELENRAGFGKRFWMSFASFLYTGQSRFLDEHIMTIYSALSQMRLTLARGKYSHFLSRNLSLENAFCILNDAVFYQDDSLSHAAAHFLTGKSGVELNPQEWIEMAKDKGNLLKFIPQSYIFKQIL